MTEKFRIVYADVRDNHMAVMLTRFFGWHESFEQYEVELVEVNGLVELADLAEEGADLLLLYASNLVPLGSQEGVLASVRPWKARGVPVLGWWAWSLDESDLWRELERLSVPLLRWPTGADELLKAIHVVMDGAVGLRSAAGGIPSLESFLAER